MRAELIVDSKCVIGEGPVWDGETGTLYFIDLLGKRIHAYDGVRLTTMQLEEIPGCAVLREGGGMVAGLPCGFCFVDFPDGAVTPIADPEARRTGSRFNDGKVDPAGRFWGGTMPRSLDSGYGEAGPDSALYCLDAELGVRTMLTGVIQANGLAWTADARTFYFIDTQRRCVQAFDYDLERNVLSNGRICVEVPPELGLPDGMTVDDKGFLWVALWGGHAVGRFDPATGALVDRVEVPAVNVTSCCFGGRGLDTLYITTAGLGTDPARYPLAGGVFCAQPGVAGRPSYKFKG